MSKADVIEVEGTVVEKLPNAPDFSDNQRKAADEFYPYSAGRPCDD